MTVYLVNTFENKGWGMYHNNHDVLIAQAVFKNKYRAMKYIKDHGYGLYKGRNSKDERGNSVTEYRAKTQGTYLYFTLTHIEVE